MPKKHKVSIIIVNYKVEKELLECIGSVYASGSKIKQEIIVVDNSHKDNVSKLLKTKFPGVKYIKPGLNLGYGGGNNLGAKNASGEFLFILNPDTKLISGKIDELVKFLEANKKAGAVAPILLDKNLKPYFLQGTKILTPKRAFFSLSFIANFFKKNRFYKDYYFYGWDKSKLKEVDVVPGTAFLIRKSLFEKLGGFDENYFLFFEEFDFCKRLRDKGFKNYITPDVKVFHEWGASTKKNEKTKTYFKKSRYYYFKKNFGSLKSLLLEFVLRINKYPVILFFTLAVGLFLRVFRLDTLMTFIADQGLFYLPARDILIQGVIPLVGPETSHPWIHHGAHWIYTLALIFKTFDFNPVAPAYFIAVLGTLTILILYLVLKDMFDEKIATLSSILFATSPLIVMNSRMPYHTSPIPFLVILLFFFTFKFIKGRAWFFPLITLFLGVLYNHEITNFVYFIVLGIILGFGFFKKSVWFKKLLNPKIIVASVISFLIPMLPFIIYDINHGFNQTLRFLVWVVYRILKFPLGLIDPSFKSAGSSPSTVPQFFGYYKNLIFTANEIVAGFLLVITITFIIFYFKDHIEFDRKKIIRISKKFSTSYLLLFLFLVISFAGLSVHRVPIEADTLLFSPFVIILTSLSLLWILKDNFKAAFLAVGLIAFINVYFLLSTMFFTNVNGVKQRTFQDQLVAVDQVINLSNGNSYNIEGRGVLSNFKSFTMPYEYLLWWKGRPPSEKNVHQKIIIWEDGHEIKVFKE